MIKQKEIVEIAARKQVPKTTIDKDWVLGHFLSAMFSFADVRDNFVFKGGTCLHKCFIKDYRFSEDLDFTLLDAGFDISKPFINKIMKKASEESGIQFHLADFYEQQSENIPQGYKAIIRFWGADHNPNQRPLPPSRWQTSINVDISFSEKLFLQAVEKDIIHPYSDANLIRNSAVCYDFTEILSEKIRALKQRNRPRDVYDVWYLSKSTDSSFPGLKELLLNKSELKGLKIEGVHDFVNKEKALRNKRAWVQSLSNQIAATDLPDFDVTYNELTTFLKTLL
ncbi:MAG TPA: nucleotidyl transferase AbiEii/AbiGii toxin family protein [Ignavibacteria bacterium]|nr:nucleotidyl transferase AbiEii/AbiGii toxin family protein [Ignavibacteria bacterium]